MKEPTSHYGCGAEDSCESCYGDAEWREKMRKENMTKIWVVGHSMRGYLPESAPFFTTDHKDAVNYQKDEIEHLADFFSEGMSQKALDAINDRGGAGPFIKWLEETRTEPVTFFDLEDMDMDAIYRTEECDIALAELDELKDGEEGGWDIHHSFYWVQECNRSEFEIPEDLEGDELEDYIEDLNQESW